MQDLISFIIPVRDRDDERIWNCILSLVKSKLFGEVIVIDYGSKEKVELSGDIEIENLKIIRYDKNKVWNKSHAINLGIREAKYDYIGTVDCDMIISEGFMRGVERHLAKNTLIYSINVKRIEPRHVSVDFNDMLKHTSDWNNSKGRYNIIHNANGGIQIYPKKWIESIGGADECLIYWGGMDNDVFERAIISGLATINLNQAILHQEHEFKKEKNLDKHEQIAALLAKIPKTEYLNKMLEEKIIIRNGGKWGLCKPNQSRFLNSQKQIKKTLRLIELGEIEYQKAFVAAVKSNKKSFMFNNKRVEVSK